jgi:serine/threonine protein kinase
MEVVTGEHPDPVRLAAFGRGALDRGEMTQIATHLAACESCCEVLCTLPDDELVDRLRASQKVQGWNAASGGDPSVAATATVAFDQTGFSVPSSFVFSAASSGSEMPPTASTTDGKDSRRAELSLEQELPPELLNHLRYRIIRKLGAGGMGSVYLAQHRVMDRPVALKVIRGDLLGKPALVERFRREVKSAAHLALHPNIVAAYDAEQAGDSHFLVMEFVDGVNLGDLVKSQGPLSVEAACDAIKQAAEGLEHAHERGMVHRDIKPQNLMRTSDGQIKILDFGLARLASEVLPDLAAAAEEEAPQFAHSMVPGSVTRVTLTDMVLGSADYIAPEQALDPRSADNRADTYSLGCTFYHLLSGEPPFPDGNLTQKLVAHASRTPRSLPEIRPDVPATVVQIVDRMIAKDRESRFQRAAEVADALARVELEERYREAFSRPETDSLAVAPSEGGASRKEELIKITSPGTQCATFVGCVSVVVGGLGLLAWYFPDFRFFLGALVTVIGFILYWLGVRSLTELAANDGFAKLMLYRFFPPYQFWFVLSRWNEARDYIPLFVAGVIVMAIGGGVVKTSPTFHKAAQNERQYQKAVREAVYGELESAPPM